ncbi:MAG: hypothetical protein QOF78_3031 [Phycisphaerales bacterium]|jgi:hypothetical protein|nr:hypothetical protein [Phycisphaerales bacterium]
MNRRQFLQASIAAAAGAGITRLGFANDAANPADGKAILKPTADAMILIWLPGGVSQTDCWDPKKHTPFEKGMKGNQLLGTCPIIDTAADGIKFGAGLETIASVMNEGAVLRSLTNETKFGAVHLKAQYYMKTGYLFPAGVKAPSIGAVVARSAGRKNPQVPAYIDIGRDINAADQEFTFINEYSGPGFYGAKYAPFMIPEPAQGMTTLNAIAGMKPDRLDRRQRYLETVAGMSAKELRDSAKVADYVKVMEDARAMMDSPIKRAFDFAKDEKPEVLKAYDVGHRFGHGCLLARRLVELGARFVEVEYQYAAFRGFDMHENGKSRMEEMKKQIDRPIGTLIRELKERGLLERTLVVVATEFGRTIANQPAAGAEPDGFAEKATGSELVIDNERMYGFHGHFSSGNSMLFFGGGMKKGFAYGKTAAEHPMIPIENGASLIDVHATIYKAMGIPADHNYVTEGRPFYVTKDGKGKAIDAMFA